MLFSLLPEGGDFVRVAWDFNPTRGFGLATTSHAVNAYASFSTRPSSFCPPDESLRTPVENLDPCVDVPPCARPVNECGPQEASSSCPEISPTARPSVCVSVPDWTKETPNTDALNGAIAVVSALSGLCARHGKAPPSGAQPERYCYLACVDSADCVLDGPGKGCIGCDGTWFSTE